MLKLIPCDIKIVKDTSTLHEWDAVCVVDRREPRRLSEFFKACRRADKAFEKTVSCIHAPGLANRIVYSPVGDLDDYDDVRVYFRAAGKAISRAIKAGAERLLLVLPGMQSNEKYTYAALSTLLGAYHELYVPIQLREHDPLKVKRVRCLGICTEDLDDLSPFVQAQIIEESRFIARDIGGGDPERMAPPRVADYVTNVFGKSEHIKMAIITEPEQFYRDYPLFQAVNRAAASVERHNGRIIFLEYIPPKPAVKTLMLVGKGVCYDTGGADIKAGGVMAGMSRDKCGAAAVAGFMHYVQSSKPLDIQVIGALCMVRNSIGEECYVSDEVITARSGERVRVGNTDAEGRMCMADVLCQMRERAIDLPDPHLFTIATLTGHAHLAHGEGYTIIMDNGPARESGHAKKLKEIGDLYGEPCEISTIQREDFTAHLGVCLGEDVVQANNLPSSRTPRGHQTPAAFMILASGLKDHGSQSEKPLKYTHLDIAGSAGDFPYTPFGAPILALAKTHL